MSILRTYNVQNPDSASVNVELSANGGVRVAGLSTFSGELRVGTGVTISSGVITATTLNATSIVGVTTAGITTVYTNSVNDGPISGARNRIINGDMRIDQRNAGASVTWSALQTNTYTIDRWQYYCDATNLLSCQRSGTAPVGFSSSVLFTSLTAASQTNKQFWWAQVIEGYNMTDLSWGTANAKPVTISFWVNSSITGTFGGSIQDNTASVSFCYTYTINSANTWEYKTINVPGPTTGTWLTDNRAGIYFRFEFNGQGFNSGTGTPNVWSSGNNTGPVGARSFIATNGATMYITGVQFEPGTVATPFERRSYGQELALAQRYYCKSFNIETAPANGITTGDGEHQIQLVASGDPHIVVYWPVIMRSSPIVTLYNPRSGGASGQWSTNASDSANARSFYATPVKAMIDNSDVSLSATYWRIAWSASAEL